MMKTKKLEVEDRWAVSWMSPRRGWRGWRAGKDGAVKRAVSGLFKRLFRQKINLIIDIIDI